MNCCWLWVLQGLDEKAYGGDRDRCQRRIEAPDEHIDALVYELYGLTEEEIAIVEEREKFGKVRDGVDDPFKQWLAEVGS